MSKPNRRAFLKSSAALAAGTAVLRNARAFVTPATATTAATPLTQFDYQDVQLLDGPMLVQFNQNHELFLNLNEDRMLKPFRQLSGLPAPGEGRNRRRQGPHAPLPRHQGRNLPPLPANLNAAD